MNSTERYEQFILIADDNVDDRFRTSTVLRKLGYAVLTAEGAEQALHIMRTVPPAAVLADAGHTGMAILERSRTDKNLMAIPLIILSEASNGMLMGRARRGIIAGFLRKPLDVGRLSLTLASSVGRGPQRSCRITASLAARITAETGISEGMVSILSDDGMFVLTSSPFPVGSLVKAAIKIDGRTIAVDAEIVFACSPGEGFVREPGIGIKFLKVAPEDRQVITSFARKAQCEVAAGTAAHRPPNMPACKRSLLLILALALCACGGYSDNGSQVPSATERAFTLLSPAGPDGGTLSGEYTCDGAGATIALTWSDVPAGTLEFALMMTTLPGDGTTKWNWVLYGIPGTATGLAKNSTVGIHGTGSHGTTMAYDPPCSQGPGAKVYTFTLYALSASPSFTVPAAQVTGPVLTEAIALITLGSTSLDLNYTR